jgi:hypothetical protein
MHAAAIRRRRTGGDLAGPLQDRVRVGVVMDHDPNTFFTNQ